MQAGPAGTSISNGRLIVEIKGSHIFALTRTLRHGRTFARVDNHLICGR